MVTFFIPFLPLERSHVRRCIERQLETTFDNEDQENFRLTKTDLADRVLDLIEFAPPDSLLYSVSGCKKVQQKLDYVLELNRIEQRKRTDEF